MNKGLVALFIFGVVGISGVFAINMVQKTPKAENFDQVTQRVGLPQEIPQFSPSPTPVSFDQQPNSQPQAQPSAEPQPSPSNELQGAEIKVGTGVEAKTGNTVSVHYTGTLIDGKKFDSSKDRGQPFSFTLGAGQVIQGWEAGILGMKIGGIRKLIIPPHLGYGEFGSPPVISPNATLVFEIELLDVK